MNRNLLPTFLTIFILSLNLQVKGQSHFKKEFTDSLHNHWDEDFIETPDSTFVIMGNESTGFSATGGFLYKITKDGQFIWRKTYHYHPNQFPIFKSICLVDSGAFIVTAILDSLYNFGVIEFDNYGNVLAVLKSDIVKAPSHPYVHNAVQRFGSGLIFLGSDLSDAHPIITKADLYGNVIWTKRLTLGASCNEKIVNMDIDSLGNIYLEADDWNNQCGTDTLTKIIKMDSTGNVVWSNQYEYGFNIKEVRCVTNNRIVITGDISTLSEPAFAMEIDSSGSISYAKQYSWTIGTQSTQISSESDSKVNVIVAKLYGSLAFYQQYIIVTDSDGSVLSANAYDDSLGNSYSEIIKKNLDGSWLLVGADIIKFDSAMNINCPPTNLQITESVIPVSQSTFAVIVDTVQASTINLNYQVVIDSLALTAEEYCLPVGIPESDIQSVAIFPNPVTDKISIQLDGGFNKDWYFEVSDLSGRIILKGRKSPGKEGAEIDLGGLNSGLYFLQIISGKSRLTRKFIVN